MDRVVWQMPDGSIRISVPVGPRVAGESDVAYLIRVATRAQQAMPSLAGASRVGFAVAASLPSRRFRKTWRWRAMDQTVQPNPVLAREQILAEVRVRRDERLRESDGDRAKLEDIGTIEQRIALSQYRQQLRDFPSVVTQEINGLSIPQLEAYAPTWPMKPT